MQYKDYTATISFDEECKIFSGEVIDIKDVITFQAESLAELEKAFHDSVDDYIEFCQSRNEKPESPFPLSTPQHIEPIFPPNTPPSPK